MTESELAAYYSNLLIMQYHEKPKAKAMVEAQASAVYLNNLPLTIQDAFNIDTAVGDQLDVLGKYVGVSRIGAGLTQQITLSDSDYRQLIKMVVIKNNSGSSLETIQSLLAVAFPGQVLISDNQTMGLNYIIEDSLGTSDLLELLATGGYLPKPMGVETSIVVVPAHINPYFGFRTYAAPDTSVAPFNNYSFYSTANLWLSYSGVS